MTLKVKGFMTNLTPSATCTNLLTRRGSTYSETWSSIGVQFSGDGNGGVNLLAPTEAAGVIVQTNWNVINIQGGGGSVAIDRGTYGNLQDNAGHTTAVQLQHIGDDAWNTGGSTATPNGKLMQGILKQDTAGSATMTLTFSNLSAGSYDEYVYGNVDGGPTTLSANIGAVTYYWIEPATFNGTFTRAASTNPGSPAAGNYVRFRGISPVNGAIRISATYRSGGGGSGGAEFGIAALQLVSVATITTQPIPSLLYAGRTATFAAVATTGLPPISYQ